MARYPKDHRQQTRERIVQAATEAFKTEGIDGVGIARVMGRAGLTHGGFYAHFQNKDDLVSAVLSGTPASSMHARVQHAREAGDGLDGVARGYLSRAHRDHPESGCVLPSLSGELARQPEAVRSALNVSLEAMLAELAGLSTAPDDAGRRADALSTLAGMVGAVALSRAVSDPSLSDEILKATRDTLTRRAAPPAPDVP
ncbi:TetR/AcrR family transcriptional regulator [Deinococcus sp.]|uniref:TetR/AcrR family transcriptional regulator n=1 Tax=Deinococcus sp. TaxID=47478 RepID=UPI002869A4A2|nr:TetR/AcrR family transcriptional regulator [Deinococcus sp.]